jgi:hypothetical protein
MDTVTYFKFMERVVLGTAGIKVYKEDFIRCSDDIEMPGERPKPNPEDMSCFDTTVGMSCPSCHVGIRVEKSSGNVECPCCSKLFSIPVVKKPTRKAA